MTIKNYIDWPSLYNNPAPFHVYLTPRGRGKTDGKAQQFLHAITTNNDQLFIWIRRRWHDSLDCSKPLFDVNIHQLCEEKGFRPSDFEVKEKGVWYQGTRRIYFIDLFSFQKQRGAIAKVKFEELVFDEAIPIDQEFLRLGEKDEQWIFHDLLQSLKRKNSNIKITFLANDYFWSSWFLDAFDEEGGKLFTIKYQAKEKAEKDDNSGVLETTSWEDFGKEEKESVTWLLYVNLIEGAYDAQAAALETKPNPSLRNWDDFMLPIYNKNGGRKEYQVEHAIQDYLFCELEEREKHKIYFFMHFTKNKKEMDSELTNFCWDLKEKANSKLENCVLRDKTEWMNRWVNMLKEGELFFTDFRSRDWFINQLRGE